MKEIAINIILKKVIWKPDKRRHVENERVPCHSGCPVQVPERGSSLHPPVQAFFLLPSTERVNIEDAPTYMYDGVRSQHKDRHKTVTKLSMNWNPPDGNSQEESRCRQQRDRTVETGHSTKHERKHTYQTLLLHLSLPCQWQCPNPKRQP